MSNFILKVPFEAKIAQTCPEGTDISYNFIKAGTSAVCTCRKNGNLNALGNVMWLSDNEVIGTPGNMFSNLIVSYPKDFGKTFRCVGKPHESDKTEIFQPLFAYGPTEIFIAAPNVTLEVCSSTNISCWTQENNFFPKATFQFSTDNVTALKFNQSVVKVSSFNYTNVITAALVGTNSVMCAIVNDLFDIRVNASLSLTVKEREESLPYISVNDGKIIAENDVVYISCQVKSKDFNVSLLNLTCLGQSSASTSKNVTISKKITKENNGSNCTCVAKYTSDCFRERLTSAQILVAYGPYTMEVGKTYLTMEKCIPRMIYCSVPATDFYPSLFFECSADVPEAFTIQSNNMNITETTSFIITALKIGSYIITCSAINMKKSTFRVDKVINIVVAELSSNIPVITLEDKQPIIDRAKNAKLTCRIAGSYTGIANLTFTCLGPPITVYETSLTIERNVTRSDSGTICTCVAYYIPACLGSLITTHQVIVIYGPTEVLPFKKYLEVDKCQPTTIGFFTLESDNYPGSRFEIVKDGSIQVISNSSKDSSYFAYFIQIVGSKSGNFSVICNATNLLYEKLFAVTSMILSIKETALTSPMFIINNGDFINENSTLRNITINCTIPVLKRALSNLTLTCQNTTVFSTSNSVTMFGTWDGNDTDCVCRAQYFDSCNGYNETSSRFNILCDFPKIEVNDNKPIIANNAVVGINLSCQSILDNNLDSNLTLSCLGDHIHVSGSAVRINKNISKDDNGAECTCSIQSSMCMEKQTTKIRLNVAYDSGILNYSIESESLVKTLNEGDKIRFVCTANSNPKPSFNITTEEGELITSEAVQTSENHWEILYIKENATCMDTKTYYCNERNEITKTESKKYIPVFIKCSPRLYTDTQTNLQRTSSKANVGLDIELLSYPMPKIIELYSGLNREKVNNSSYVVAVKVDKLPIITVVVLLHNSDLTDYILNISNGIGQDLLYSFKVTSVDEQVIDKSAVIALAVLLCAALITGIAFFLQWRRAKNATHLTVNRSDRQSMQWRPLPQVPSVPVVQRYTDTEVVPSAATMLNDDVGESSKEINNKDTTVFHKDVHSDKENDENIEENVETVLDLPPRVKAMNQNDIDEETASDLPPRVKPNYQYDIDAEKALDLPPRVKASNQDDIDEEKEGIDSSDDSWDEKWNVDNTDNLNNLEETVIDPSQEVTEMADELFTQNGPIGNSGDKQNSLNLNESLKVETPEEKDVTDDTSLSIIKSKKCIK
ncbi:hypothetical protein Btru_041032 [Bulinus truncatus]|nr:hypothetical protein Btru_041032 [Bulinus truncatus]